MPVRQMGPRQPNPAAQQLRARLAAEWINPTSAPQPIILEEHDGAGRLSHVYVVWDDWENLTGVERSEIILDACEARYGRAHTMTVTIAMGLTRAEADRFGIRYQ
jgi:hypothetical protein